MKQLISIYAFILVISWVELMTIPLIRQEAPIDGLHRLPDHFQNKIAEILKPKPHNVTTDTIALYRYLDTEFFGVVGIGHPVKYFNMAFETTWGNSWVMSDDCPPAVMACWFHNKYNGADSSSHEDNGTLFTANETIYSISGFMSIDTIHLAHLNVTNFAFAEITSLPWTFMLSKADGVIGMAKKDIITEGSPPFYYDLFEKNIIKEPVFSVYINRDPQSQHGGSIFLGGVEPKHFNGSFTYVRSDNPFYWQFKVDKIDLIFTNTKKNRTFCANGCDALIDTSTTNIVGPDQDIQFINRLIKAKPIAYGRYEIDCATIMKLPPINFKIEGEDFTIKGPDYVRKVAYHGVQLCISCFQPSRTKSQTWSLGGAFLGNYYTTFDLANERIGFATVK